MGTPVTVSHMSILLGPIRQVGTGSQWLKMTGAQLIAALDSKNLTVLQGFARNHKSLFVKKPVFGVSDQVQHRPGCTVTEDG